MEIQEKYLPIGTVVILKGGKKKVMITGFISVAVEAGNEKVYDYSGCIYPEGFLSSDQVCLFNHEQIEQVFYLGFVNEEEKEFKEKLRDFANTVNLKPNEEKTSIKEAENIIDSL